MSPLSSFGLTNATFKEAEQKKNRQEVTDKRTAALELRTERLTRFKE